VKTSTESLPASGSVRDSHETRPLPKNSHSTAAPWWMAALRKVIGLLPSPGFGVLGLIERDRPHVGMESRTRAIRFEDMHGDTAGTMRDLSGWLGLSYQATMLDSTFNGSPYVVARDGKAWSGPRLEQVKRQSRYVSSKDRALLFALFHENFVAWNYPCPRIFGNPIVRCIVFASLFFLPMKMEIIAARAALKGRILPAVRHGNISIAMRSLLGILFCRLAIIWLIVPDFVRRRAHRVTSLQLNQDSRALPQ
jgi:hypothetical protein